MSGKPASLRSHTDEEGRLVLELGGYLDASSLGEVWRQAQEVVARVRPGHLQVNAAGVEYADGAGMALLVELRCQQMERNANFDLQGLSDNLQNLLQLYAPPDFEKPVVATARPPRIPEEVGRISYAVWCDLKQTVAFLGELAAALYCAVSSRGCIRWREVLLVGEKAGVNALPIIALISFLVGLIMAFQAAVPMRQFGVEIYVADLVALSILRELGPLMTALTLAGRSGSSFAAEIGTMKVNEEIDALQTMGLDPVRFLVVVRVVAAVLLTPLLAVFAGLVGVAGGSIVLLSMGYPLITYVNQVISAVSWVDFSQGLLKSIVFGLIFSGIGCFRGLQTQTGPSAVGDSATRAVVSGIILIVVMDGIFAVIFYFLGI
ncbi:MAG: STAS domain-containing protein [Desulfuromonadales bacterium]|nr:STAS domain-containing protein [Desulfuromonadales bacterium]NIR33516.1 STAS domain-containing protein [Desulfuromonadales bacterium]NIS39690.1 STAS domain-containing protein [Desulfuromonadales bacterium]